MTDKLYTAKDLKQFLRYYLLWRLHFEYVIDEYNYMDIFGVRKNGYSVEFEIKVSKSDLDRELTIIRMEHITDHKDWRKFEKHTKYLSAWRTGSFSSGRTSMRVPNSYCFCVSPNLGQYAAAKVSNLPYGVVTFEDSYGYRVIKKPQKLHTHKTEIDVVSDIANSLTYRNYELHKKIRELEHSSEVNP